MGNKATKRRTVEDYCLLTNTFCFTSALPLSFLSAQCDLLRPRGEVLHTGRLTSAFKSVETKSVWLRLRPGNLPVASVICDTLDHMHTHTSRGQRRSKSLQASRIVALFKCPVSFSQFCLELFPVRCQFFLLVFDQLVHF